MASSGPLTSGIFNESYPPIMDGVAIATRNYAWWLSQFLGPAWVVAPEVPGHRDDEPFEVLRYRSLPVPMRPPYRLGVPVLDPSYRRALDRIAFDVVHAHSPFSAGLEALRVAQRRGIPCVATFHSKYREDFRQALPLGPLVDSLVARVVRFYERADEVWVPNPGTGEVLREYGYRGAFEVVPNGVDIAAPDDLPALRQSAAATLHVPEGVPLLLYVGQHVWEKNNRLLIEALADLRRRGRTFRMIFVGEGYARPGMEHLAARLGLGDAVRFAGVVTDRSSIRGYFARADLFLFPSRYDNAPLVVKEAAAFRTPTVALAGSTVAADLRDGENGFVVAGEVSALAERLDRLLDDPDAIRRAGDGAFASLFHPWRDVVADVAERYRALVRRHRRGGAATRPPPG